LAYRLLLGLGVLDAAGYSIIVPVAPAIADQTGAGPATIGLLVASFPLGMVAGFWLAAQVMRRRGVRPLLLVSLGPLVGGAVAEHVGYAAIGLLPAAAGLVVLTLAFTSRARQPGPT
jgi:MFS family permease